MKNLKELQPILAAIYCINRTNGNKDPDIEHLVDYTFWRLLGKNTRLLLLDCIGKTKETIMPELHQLLEEDTHYPEFLKKLEVRKNEPF